MYSFGNRTGRSKEENHCQYRIFSHSKFGWSHTPLLSILKEDFVSTQVKGPFIITLNFMEKPNDLFVLRINLPDKFYVNS